MLSRLRRCRPRRRAAGPVVPRRAPGQGRGAACGRGSVGGRAAVRGGADRRRGGRAQLRQALALPRQPAALENVGDAGAHAGRRRRGSVGRAAGPRLCDRPGRRAAAAPIPDGAHAGRTAGVLHAHRLAWAGRARRVRVPGCDRRVHRLRVPGRRGAGCSLHAGRQPGRLARGSGRALRRQPAAAAGAVGRVRRAAHAARRRRARRHPPARAIVQRQDDRASGGLLGVRRRRLPAHLARDRQRARRRCGACQRCAARAR